MEYFIRHGLTRDGYRRIYFTGSMSNSLYWTNDPTEVMIFKDYPSALSAAVTLVDKTGYRTCGINNDYGGYQILPYRLIKNTDIGEYVEYNEDEDDWCYS